MGPDPAVAAVRLAVRRSLDEIRPGARVLVACSGGADSLALADALAFEARRSGHQAGGITVDHGLQAGSAERAEQVAAILRGLNLDPVETIAVAVGRRGGPEAAARDARYTAFAGTADRMRAAAIMLGHTLNDQAETVLLGLARGSGARSLAGMSSAAGRYRRPLLGLDRATTRRACRAMGLQPWDDPHNDDPAFTRVRVRKDALPALERALGPGVAEALARTARLLGDDADALDVWATRAYQIAVTTARPAANVARSAENVAAAAEYVAEAAESAARASGHPSDRHDDDGVAVDVDAVRDLPRAVRTRVLRRAAIAAGCPAGTLAVVHVAAVDELITAWRGQRRLDLPGGVRAERRCGKLLFARE